MAVYSRHADIWLILLKTVEISESAVILTALCDRMTPELS